MNKLFDERFSQYKGGDHVKGLFYYLERKRNVEMILSNEFERCVQTDREGSEPISAGGSDAARAG